MDLGSGKGFGVFEGGFIWVKSCLDINGFADDAYLHVSLMNEITFY